jgi:hypothetical protein
MGCVLGQELAYSSAADRKTLSGVSLRAHSAVPHELASMLQRNPLHPSRPLPMPTPARAGTSPTWSFVSAEDFDVTGMLTGVDPCESRYWWMPELYGPDADAPAAALHATRRTSSWPTAAA